MSDRWLQQYRYCIGKFQTIYLQLERNFEISLYWYLQRKKKKKNLLHSSLSAVLSSAVAREGYALWSGR